MESKIKIDGVEIELQEYNVDELEELIEELRSRPTGGKGTGSLCDNLRKELLKQQGISLQTIIHTTIDMVSYWWLLGQKGEPVANKISNLLFNKILPRLD